VDCKGVSQQLYSMLEESFGSRANVHQAEPQTEGSCIEMSIRAQGNAIDPEQ
jgi:hypothetical protein